MSARSNWPCLAALTILVAACSTGARPPATSVSTEAIAVSSTPAAGARVSVPVNKLELRFSRPARVDEVTITGPDGTMPMMVDAVGEVREYSIPLPGLGAGQYTVAWKASEAGRETSGTFSFTVQP